MYTTITSAVHKKNKTDGDLNCVIGATDDHQLAPNQHKNGSKLSLADPFDAITREPLEVRHVQYVSPDHNLKCCYNSSTLDRCRSSQGYLLQPPHFRIPMNSADARKIEGAFGIPYLKQSAESFERATVQERVSSNTRLRDWAMAEMGSSQLWCCPICWSYMTCSPQELTSSEISEQRTLTNPIQRCTDYLIARSISGGDGLRELGSTLSVNKTSLKHHLLHAHDTLQAPTELLNAYSLRGDDGILHRYLSRRGYSNESAHGALLSYWRHNPEMFGGTVDQGVGFNKFLYLYLHHYAPRIASGVLPGLEPAYGNAVMTALSRPFSTKATAYDDEFLDEEDYTSAGPVRRREDIDRDSEEAHDANAQISGYKERDASGYMDAETLEALIAEEAKQMGSESESESEDESERYKREKKEKELRIKKRRYIESSDSDSDDEFLAITTSKSSNSTFLDDSDEED